MKTTNIESKFQKLPQDIPEGCLLQKPFARFFGTPGFSVCETNLGTQHATCSVLTILCKHDGPSCRYSCMGSDVDTSKL